MVAAREPSPRPQQARAALGVRVQERGQPHPVRRSVDVKHRLGPGGERRDRLVGEERRDLVGGRRPIAEPAPVEKRDVGAQTPPDIPTGEPRHVERGPTPDLWRRRRPHTQMSGSSDRQQLGVQRGSVASLAAHAQRRTAVREEPERGAVACRHPAVADGSSPGPGAHLPTERPRMRPRVRRQRDLRRDHRLERGSVDGQPVLGAAHQVRGAPLERRTCRRQGQRELPGAGRRPERVGVDARDEPLVQQLVEGEFVPPLQLGTEGYEAGVAVREVAPRLSDRRHPAAPLTDIGVEVARHLRLVEEVAVETAGVSQELSGGGPPAERRQRHVQRDRSPGGRVAHDGCHEELGERAEPVDLVRTDVDIADLTVCEPRDGSARSPVALQSVGDRALHQPGPISSSARGSTPAHRGTCPQDHPASPSSTGGPRDGTTAGCRPAPRSWRGGGCERRTTR